VTSRWDWAAAKFYRDAESDLSKGDLEGAHRNVGEALRRAPSFWPILYTRAKLFSRERKWDLAIRDCNEVLRQYSAWAPAALLRAQINAHIGNYAAARREFDHVIEIEPRKEFYGMAFDARAWFRATCPDASFRNPQGAIDDDEIRRGPGRHDLPGGRQAHQKLATAGKQLFGDQNGE